VHLAGIVPPDLVLVRIELPEAHSFERPMLSDLPKDWRRVPPGAGGVEFGTVWARENRSLVLYVPSALLPEEERRAQSCSPEFTGVKMTIRRAFSYDPRMFMSGTRHR
jgi:hypothetical protein